MPARVALINLGCPKNLVDAEVMSAHLLADGFELTSDPEDAEVIVVNTCGFLEASSQEAVDALLEAAEQKRIGRCRAVIGVGCMVQRYRDSVAAALPEVDGFLGTGQAAELPGLARRVLAGQREARISGPAAGFESYIRRLPSGPQATAYVKVSEGCDRRCSFCAIPGIRGPMVSRRADDIVREVEGLTAAGVREVILIGQDPNRYGLDGDGPGMVPLLERLCEVERLRWLRLMYLFPDRRLEPILEAVARLPKVCDYVDVPFQHAAPQLLRAMNRPGSGQEYLRLVQNLRRTSADLAWRSTFIVGFPGETEAQFQQVLDFLEAAELDWAGAFVYSSEEGTPARSLPGAIPAALGARRYDTLMRRQQAITQRRLRRWVGRETEVLLTEVNQVEWRGRTPQQAPEVDGLTRLQPGSFAARPGDFVTARITGTTQYDLCGVALRVTQPAEAPAGALMQLAMAG